MNEFIFLSPQEMNFYSIRNEVSFNSFEVNFYLKIVRPVEFWYTIYLEDNLEVSLQLFETHLTHQPILQSR